MRAYPTPDLVSNFTPFPQTQSVPANQAQGERSWAQPEDYNPSTGSYPQFRAPGSVSRERYAGNHYVPFYSPYSAPVPIPHHRPHPTAKPCIPPPKDRHSAFKDRHSAFRIASINVNHSRRNSTSGGVGSVGERISSLSRTGSRSPTMSAGDVRRGGPGNDARGGGRR